MSMFDDDLIENVKKYPILYRSKGKNFRNIIKKGNCWIKIAAELNKTPEECKSKWRNIRDNYIKNKKKKITGGGSASYSKYDDERLNFLSESLNESETSSNVDNSASGNTSYITCDLVKEEYDSSEEIPLSESPFFIATTNNVVDTEQPTTSYPTPTTITASFEPNHSVFAAQQNLSVPVQNLSVQEQGATPPPKRAMKRKIDSIIDELKKDREERYLIIQQLVTKATSTRQSPIHNFFSSMADIVCNFPPEKIAEVRMKICSMVSDVELSVLRDRSQSASRF